MCKVVKTRTVEQTRGHAKVYFGKKPHKAVESAEPSDHAKPQPHATGVDRQPAAPGSGHAEETAMTEESQAPAALPVKAHATPELGGEDVVI